eukprot:TRINITY_DN1326_c0_g3_i1.p1 TRINITY_DN1326_c0_g3~~TRINITY_DN1326_c0_g3_i1.p1  ORF type:complete len:204 (-),score=-11.77 TRINITY_DN1326_c0_g3_i1:1476-2087(-)
MVCTSDLNNSYLALVGKVLAKFAENDLSVKIELHGQLFAKNIHQFKVILVLLCRYYLGNYLQYCNYSFNMCQTTYVFGQIHRSQIEAILNSQICTVISKYQIVCNMHEILGSTRYLYLIVNMIMVSQFIKHSIAKLVQAIMTACNRLEVTSYFTCNIRLQKIDTFQKLMMRYKFICVQFVCRVLFTDVDKFIVTATIIFKNVF